MKILQLTLIALLCNLSIQAQSFIETSKMIGMNARDIIDNKNAVIGDGVLKTRLRDVSPLPNGGFSLDYYVYYSQSTQSYYFNREKICTSFQLIQDIENKDEQIEYFLANGFMKIDNNIYYNPVVDLQVKLEFDEKFVSFLYSRRPKLLKKK